MGELMEGNRREFLQGTGIAIMVVLAHAICPGALVASTEFSREAIARLAALARQLFPYDDLAEEVYVTVISDLLANTKNSEALQACAEQLDGFLTMNGSEQIDAIRQIETMPFFNEVRVAVLNNLHNRQELWTLIGYEGPALRFGGYTQEERADLDWLDRS